MANVPEITPRDEHNLALLSNVQPTDWTNPTPSGRYNMVVIGAGSAGLITAAVAAGLGAKVALIERHFMGGDCLNVGCVPSKGVIRAARTVAEARSAARYGLQIPEDAEVDFAAVMERMRGVRARISKADAVARYQNELGVDVYLGDAHFVGRDAIEVGGATLHFRRACIAAGARAAAPPLEGLADAGYLTNETIFNLTERPRRLGVIGAGPIGCELSQAFRRLGSEVTIFDRAEHVLAREDADAAEIVQRHFVEEGVRLELGVRIEKIERRGDEKVIRIEGPGGSRECAVDEILVAVGRAPNVEGLDLETAGVEFDERRGVHVNDYLQTANPHIYAAGDICMRLKFTHAADAAAKIVVQNALFFRSAKVSSLVMPWCTYTDPEIAHVGLYEHEAHKQGIEIDTFQVGMEEIDRALADGEEDGFIKVHVKKGTDKILGATLVAAHAGELLSEITVAMVHGLGLSKIMKAIHPYPTQAEIIKRVAGAYTRSRATPRVTKLLKGFMRLRR